VQQHADKKQFTQSMYLTPTMTQATLKAKHLQFDKQ